MKNSYYKIKSFLITFLDKDGRAVEYHKTTYNVSPFCAHSENIKATIMDALKEAIGNDKKRRKVIKITTTKGTFYFNKL